MGLVTGPKVEIRHANPVFFTSLHGKERLQAFSLSYGLGIHPLAPAIAGNRACTEQKD
jgi:hypothetical protein